MTATQWALLAFIVITVFWIVGARNRLVALRNAIVVAWGEIDAQMQRRAAALPPLLAALAEQLPGEQATVDAITAAEQQAQAAAQAVRARPTRADAAQAMMGAEASLVGLLVRLRSLIDANAELRAGAEVAERLNELQDVESRLGFARRRYNEAVDAYNEAAAQFPTRMVSHMFGFDAAGKL